jgi:glycosyltransferase involved in cell wall biosynthesis
MACGVPVVATTVGGIPEVVEDGVTGLLEPVGSVEAMGRRAVELLRDRPRWEAMRAAAIARARTYSVDAVVPQYERYYAEVLG